MGFKLYDFSSARKGIIAARAAKAQQKRLDDLQTAMRQRREEKKLGFILPGRLSK